MNMEGISERSRADVEPHIVIPEWMTSKQVESISERPLA